MHFEKMHFKIHFKMHFKIHFLKSFFKCMLKCISNYVGSRGQRLSDNFLRPRYGKHTFNFFVLKSEKNKFLPNV
jgi:hypothetical protein